jgi:putative drug exporter of the RND superfamily
MSVHDSRTPSDHGRLGRLGAFVHRHRGRVVLGWVAALAAILALTPLLRGTFQADFATKGSESERAATVLAEHFPGRSGDTVTVVWKASAGAQAPRTQARVQRFLAAAQRVEGIGSAGPIRVAPDRAIASTTLELDRRVWDLPDSTGTRLIDLAQRASGDGLTVALGGGPIRMAEGGGGPEGFGLLGAAVVLLIAFGSIVAAGLPLAIALFGLAISASLIGVLAAVMQVPDFAPAIAGLLGIGVGVDYALLVLTRFRAGLDGGAGVEGAIVEAVGTAGRSVLVAGSTVLTSVLGLFLMGVGYLQGVAVSASLAVLVVMAAAVTLLPALLSYAGPRVNSLRIPALPWWPLGVRPRLTGRRQRHPAGRALRSDRPSPAVRWSRVIQRRPWTAAIAGAAIVLALAAPVLGLRLGFPDEGNDQAGSMTRTAYDLTVEGFGPGANGPLLVVAELPEAQSTQALDPLVRAARADRDVAYVSDPRPSPDGRAAIVTVAPRSAPQADATTALVERMRDRIVPGALGAGGVTVHVGGATAGLVDQSELVARRLPLFIAGVVGLSFLLLLSAFRSPVIALKAGVMNLLSVGAAYGVMALFAGGGWFGSDLLGIDRATPVAPFIPVMMFAILFGLSMDYEVFLLSRVREEFLGHGDTARAVTDGLAKTARVITAAAAIMVVVFLAFVTSGEIFLKLLGIGMATAVLVDATVVRMVLVPALMQLFGRANWWMPRWLDRAVPRLAPEAS